SPRPSPPGEGEARTVAGNLRALWCGIASRGWRRLLREMHFKRRTPAEFECSFFLEPPWRPDIPARTTGRGVAQVVAAFFGERLQAGHHVRILVGQIVGFADIVFQIEQRQTDVA